ncbi:hypothetical protein PsorP6_002221 [Peronosclerospora sorghi]|uniref:Uncharacterized protein n=1 Tax=Peronosclerospora sorghi TaxID=230839 RepID=A0ACC0WTJ4_9STRA|nr:hypothetical protein PsorP6_002221 [Peronosclerospora sorghi]
MSSQKWLMAASVALLAVPLAYYQHQHNTVQKKHCNTIKLLRKVEQIALEVELRLMHLEAQVTELANFETKKEVKKTDAADLAANSSLNSCTSLVFSIVFLAPLLTL